MKYLIILFLLLSNQSFSQSQSTLRAQLDPYTFIESGSYSINGIDSGSMSGFGLGTRAGISTSWLWLGLDATLVKPSFKSDSSTVDRIAHPLPDGQSLISYGAGASIKLGSKIKLSYTYFLDQNLKADISNGTTSAQYEYHGTGWKAGIDFQIAEGFHIFGNKTITKFDQFDVSSDIGVLTAGNKQNRTTFEIDAWSVGVGFKLNFGSLGNFSY